MHLRKILPCALLLAALVAAAPAQAAPHYRVGIGDQWAGLFGDARFNALGIKRVRYLVPWDWYRHSGQEAEVAGYMTAARAAGKDLLVTFTARRGCFDNGRYSRSSACRAPSVSAYRSAVNRFRRAYPFVKTYAAWNEANHVSQPTYRDPTRAASYFKTLRSACRGCKVMAADVLDSSNVRSWLRSFLRRAGSKARLFGLHNYSDVNRERSRMTRVVLDTVPGEVWLTETGGIVKFLPNFPYSESRAASRTKYMFKLADTYDTRRKGLRSRITRLYVYRWYGEGRAARFDAGLTSPDGAPRAGYTQYAKYAARRLK